MSSVSATATKTAERKASPTTSNRYRFDSKDRWASEKLDGVEQTLTTRDRDLLGGLGRGLGRGPGRGLARLEGWYNTRVQRGIGPRALINSCEGRLFITKRTGACKRRISSGLRRRRLGVVSKQHERRRHVASPIHLFLDA